MLIDVMYEARGGGERVLSDGCSRSPCSLVHVQSGSVFCCASVCRARGSARLVEPHRFTEPAGKVHFLHLGPFYKRVVLQYRRQNRRKE